MTDAAGFSRGLATAGGFARGSATAGGFARGSATVCAIEDITANINTKRSGRSEARSLQLLLPFMVEIDASFKCHARWMKR